MNNTVTQLERYLRDTLGITPRIAPWKGEGSLPFFLRDRYGFYRARILGTSCVFMVDRGEREEPPAAIRKHVDAVQAGRDESVVYVREHVTAYRRKRLVEQKLPFVVPGNQMYLPGLGLDFREHFRKPHHRPGTLRPSSQALLLYALLRDAEGMGPTLLAGALGYSAMTMSRAFDELDAAGLCESSHRGRGRDRRLHLGGARRDVWERALPFLKSPVKSRRAVHLVPGKRLPGPKAGWSALAHYSMLAEPENVVVALGREDWKFLESGDEATPAMAGEADAVIVEVWTYAPALLAEDGQVDRLSLYLSMRDMEEDERVQAALHRMMEDMPW